VATGLAAVLPIGRSGDYSGLVGVGGLYVVAILLIGACQFVAAVRVAAAPQLGGLGAGAGAAAAGFFGSFAAITSLVVPIARYGPGVYAMWVAAVLGVVSFFAGRAEHRALDPVAARPAPVIGLISALTLGIGTTLVPPHVHASLAEWNYMGAGSDSKFALAVQAFVWLPVLGAAVGFMTKQRWGVHCALAALAPLLWITLFVVVDPFSARHGGPFTAAIRESMHPLALVGAAGVGLAVVMALARRGLTAAKREAGSPPRWAPDPFGRHESRYWDGSRWTDVVSSSTESLREPPAPAGNGESRSAEE